MDNGLIKVAANGFDCPRLLIPGSGEKKDQRNSFPRAC